MADRLRWRVAEVVAETPDTHSFVLEPLDETPAPYRAGQFLTVRVPSERTGHVARSYSFSSAPATGEPARITVRRTADGYASNWLCDQIGAGDVIESLAPGGVFTPADLTADLLLVGGGSGITPVLSILKEALRRGTGHVVLLYASRDEASVIFADEVRTLQQAHPDRLTVMHWLESVQGRPDAAVLGLLRPYLARETWICGPGPFMELVESGVRAAGADPSRVHVERFVSLTSDPFRDGDESADDEGNATAATLELTLDGVKHELPWPPGKRLLEVALDAGLPAPYSCREGACSACACLVELGEVEMERNDVLSAEDLADGVVLSCQARALTDRVRASYDA
jgi:3-ketosteroid 9alpha-monooxygenase subunit B